MDEVVTPSAENELFEKHRLYGDVGLPGTFEGWSTVSTITLLPGVHFEEDVRGAGLRHWSQLKSDARTLFQQHVAYACELVGNKPFESQVWTAPYRTCLRPLPLVPGPPAAQRATGRGHGLHHRERPLGRH